MWKVNHFHCLFFLFSIYPKIVPPRTAFHMICSMRFFLSFLSIVICVIFRWHIEQINLFSRWWWRCIHTCICVCLGARFLLIPIALHILQIAIINIFFSSIELNGCFSHRHKTRSARHCHTSAGWERDKQKNVIVQFSSSLQFNGFVPTFYVPTKYYTWARCDEKGKKNERK